MKSKKLLGSRVAAKRKDQDLSLVALGRKAGVGKSTIAYLEAGDEKSNISLDKADAIAEALGAPLWCFLSPKNIDLSKGALVDLLAICGSLDQASISKLIDYAEGLKIIQTASQNKEKESTTPSKI